MQKHLHEFSASVLQALHSLANNLHDALGEDANVQVQPKHQVQYYFNDQSAIPDGIVNIETPLKQFTIFVEVISNGYPRDVREAVRVLENCTARHSSSTDCMGMVVAEALSPGAKKELKKRGIGFFEAGGSLFFKHGFWLINVQKPASPSAAKQTVQLFTGARENVIHALLMHAHQWLTGTDLAKLAETSEYTCSRVLQELTAREWAESTGGGPTRRRRLVDPGSLLDAWATAWQGRKQKSSKGYFFVEEPRLLLTRLTDLIEHGNTDFPWAFTGTAAANLFAPLLTHTQGTELIVPTGYAGRMAGALGLEPAEKGANVTLVERDGASLLFRDRYPEYPAFFASPYILYLDLLDGRGRNKELAEHLKHKLEASWAMQ